MKIKVLYREITNCTECPFYCKTYSGAVCNHPDRGNSNILENAIPPDCPLPDMRLDTEDDSSE